MNRYYACLWDGRDLPHYSGKAYDVRYVLNLLRNIRRHDPQGHLTMLVDPVYWSEVRDTLGLESEHHRLAPFRGDDVGGWSRVLEIFRPDLRPDSDQRCLAVGLDTVFVDNPQWLFDWNLHPVGLPLDPYSNHHACDAVIGFSLEGAEMIWARYLKERAKNRMADCLFGRLPSEMVLLRHMWKENQWAPWEPKPRKLLSYKCHVLGFRHPKDTAPRPVPMDEAIVVYFHGNPKPKDLPKDDPIRKEWES